MDKRETQLQPPYDQETFELMMDDYLFDHYTDESVDGQITIDRGSIEWDVETKHWTASCKFDGDEHWYMLVGYSDGTIELYS